MRHYFQVAHLLFMISLALNLIELFCYLPVVVELLWGEVVAFGDFVEEAEEPLVGVLGEFMLLRCGEFVGVDAFGRFEVGAFEFLYSVENFFVNLFGCGFGECTFGDFCFYCCVVFAFYGFEFVV